MVLLVYGVSSYSATVLWIWIKQVIGITTNRTQKDKTHHSIWSSQELHHK